MTKALRQAGEPVRLAAEGLAVSEISHMGSSDWNRMRLGGGVSTVYIAPAKRSSRNPSRKRPNLGRLLLDRAMWPALVRNRAVVEARLEIAIGKVANLFERT